MLDSDRRTRFASPHMRSELVLRNAHRAYHQRTSSSTHCSRQERLTQPEVFLRCGGLVLDSVFLGGKKGHCGVPRERIGQIQEGFRAKERVLWCPFADQELQIRPRIHEKLEFSLQIVDSKDSMAEGEGFEPPVPFQAQRFSRPPVSTAHPSLRGWEAIACLPAYRIFVSGHWSWQRQSRSPLLQQLQPRLRPRFLHRSDCET